MTAPDLPPLSARHGLPDALRVLADLYPREGWSSHRNFDELTRFWLDRHIGFRRLARVLTDDAEAFGSGQTDPGSYAPRLARLMQMFLGGLVEHHTIEDDHFFPLLAACDARLVRGFELMDADHVVLHDHITALAGMSNTVLAALREERAAADGALRIRDQLEQFNRFLDRHLIDEEELVVPVILEYAPRLMG